MALSSVPKNIHGLLQEDSGQRHRCLGRICGRLITSFSGTPGISGVINHSVAVCSAILRTIQPLTTI